MSDETVTISRELYDAMQSRGAKLEFFLSRVKHIIDEERPKRGLVRHEIRQEIRRLEGK